VVERQLPKLNVAGSIPVSRSKSLKLFPSSPEPNKEAARLIYQAGRR
jgi:hypothetical protein